MEDKDNLPTVPTVTSIDVKPLDNDINDIAQKLIDEKDVDTSKDLIQLFNWNLSKKNALRILKLSGLYDNITDQMIERFQKRSGEFSNSDLLSYLQTVESSMEKSQKNLTQIDTQPVVSVQNNTQVNFNVLDGFDSESKDRIANAIKSILNSAKTESPMSEDTGVPIADATFTDITEDKMNDEVKDGE